MPAFSIHASDKPGLANLRSATRPVHLQHLERFASSIIAAGALLNADGIPVGSSLIVEMDDIGAVKRFMAADPYAKAGLFGAVEIAPIRLVYPVANERSTRRID